MHTLFERQVTKTPDSRAIICDQSEVTYFDLNAEANQLAHYLRRCGVRPEDRVAVCLGRDVLLVVAIIAISKAGAAYVPLDPSYPRAWLNGVLADSGATFLVSTRTSPNLNVGRDATILMDRDLGAVRNEPKDNPTNVTLVDNLFAVVFTSGSTGVPKGVLVTHRVVANRLEWVRRAYALDSRDVGVLNRSFALISFAAELFGPLTTGAGLVVLSDAQARQPTLFWQALVRHGVTHIRETPASSDTILGRPAHELRQWRTLRLVFVAAEPASMKLFKRWKQAFPKAQILTGYGLTECSVCTSYEVSGLESDTATVPAGTTAANIRALVYDRQLQSVPVGTIGEVFVGGESLARGYFQAPRLTAERFIPHPHPGRPGEVLFRTGDIGRRRKDGLLEVLGRFDRQTKIRGFRIELDDVETAVRNYNGIKQVAVIAERDSKAELRLVAYVVCDTDTPQQYVAGLRRYLSRIVPQYMVPSRIVPMHRLPLTASGKLDRLRLAQSDCTNNEVGSRASTPTEESLVAIYRDVLNLPSVDIDDSFFHIGGHSLAAMRILARVRERFGIELQVSDIFNRETVADLATHIDSSSGT